MSIVCRPELRAIHRIEPGVPVRILRAVHDQSLERQFGRAPRRLRLTSALPPRRLFGLRLHDVDRRHGADFDARLVVLHELAGEIERLLGDFDRLRGEHVIPVGVSDIRQRVGDRRAQLDVRDVAIDPVTCSCCRVESILKLRSSGCTYDDRPVRIERRVEQRVSCSWSSADCCSTWR